MPICSRGKPAYDVQSLLVMTDLWMTLNIALVGYGYAGRVFHAPLIQACPGLQLHTLVSSKSASETGLHAVRHLQDIDAALADPQLDALVIATPNDSHAALACRALDAGKHVLVDKPLATRHAEAAAIFAAAGRAGKIASVFQNRRWDADFLTLQTLIEEGQLGRIAEFHSHFDRHRPQPRQRWRESDAPGAGLWFDLGPHLLDQALQLFGSPLALQADIGRQREGAQGDDYFDITLFYPSMRAHLHAGSLVLDARLRFAVHGERGSFVKYGLDQQEKALLAGQVPGQEGWGQDPQAGTLSQLDAEGACIQQTIAGKPGDYLRCYSGWRDAMLGLAEPPVSVTQALQLMELLELAVRSSRQGQRLALPNPQA